MMISTAQRLRAMIEAAEAKIIEKDSNYQTAEDGRFQVYLTPVEQRTRSMEPHYRVGYYLLVDGKWKRTNKAAFVAEMEEQEIRKYADSQTTDEGFPLNPSAMVCPRCGLMCEIGDHKLPESCIRALKSELIRNNR